MTAQYTTTTPRTVFIDIMEEVETFGAWLLRQLERVGASQRSLAISVGKTPAHISKVVNGKVGVSPELVTEIADALSMSRADAMTAWLAARDAHGEEMTSEPDPDAAYMMASYNGLDAPDKEIARRMIDALRKTERAKGIAGGLIRPRRPA